ncbi:MAG: DUF4905 domain-containing protein [Arcicella sp.]|nr:DUF4905 domain-containing protein [Arcicella sp.]
MHKKFEHQFEGKIWNTAFGDNTAVLEIREENTRQVSFSALDLQNGKILWQNLRPEKSWWLALVGVFDDYLILHKYSSQQKPEPKGLLILNLQTGEIIQKIEGWIFFSYQQNNLMVYQLDENNLPIYQEIILENLSKKSFKAKLSQNSSPTHYPEGSPHFPTIFNFLYRLMGIEAQKGVDYLEIANKIVISYYIYSTNLFQNYLLVITHDRQILLNDLIATTEGIGIDTFTLQSDTLLYVKNENYFVGYEL